MIYDLIIIGGGPAGVTAGIYASRKKLNTLLITKDFFGQISKTGQVDNWPGDMAISGMALSLKLEKHLKQFPIEIKTGQKVVSVEKQGNLFEVRVDNNEKYQAKSLIVATGRNAKTLGIVGEEEFVGKGLSYCSICDAPFFRDKQVAVVGGGNAGFETALDLAKYAKEVFIFEKTDKIYADEILVEKALQLSSGQVNKIKVCLQSEIIRIEGDGKVESIVYKDLISNKEMQQPMEGIFVQIGSIPATLFLGKLVDFNEKNEIKVNPLNLETSVKGILAAGDCNDTKWKQAIVASGQGAVAALSVYEYLQKNF
jgi:NADH-dependent peroxiredoxin subunit F